MISKRRLASLATASAMIATMAVASMPMAALAAKPGGATSTPPPSYHNGFEKAGDAVMSDTYPQGTAMFNVERVASGTDGISADAGRWYATADQNAYAFTRYGGYSATFPTNGYTTSVDIYLDMAEATGGDLRFDWDSAISNSSGGFLRDFIFSVGTKPSVPGSFVVSASNNAPGNPSGGADPLTISNSGWYTFEHQFKNVNGRLSVDMSVIDATGIALRTWTLSTDEISTVGGNRYGWLVYNDFETLALDNLTRVRN